MKKHTEITKNNYLKNIKIKQTPISKFVDEFYEDFGRMGYATGTSWLDFGEWWWPDNDADTIYHCGIGAIVRILPINRKICRFFILVIFKNTKFKSDVLEAISKLKLKNIKNHFSILAVLCPAYSIQALWNYIRNNL